MGRVSMVDLAAFYRHKRCLVTGHSGFKGSWLTIMLREMGAEALVDSAAVAGLFNAIDRVADSTGIPLEDEKAQVSEDIRAELGINEFASMKAS